MNILITGSSGLIGSAGVEYFTNQGHNVTGVDNNSRMKFFGPDGNISWNTRRLLETCKNFSHLNLDICNKEGVDYLFMKNKFDMVLHFASQPAHDFSYRFPYTDFQVNVVGTVNLLEACRLHTPHALFIFTSTSKVYGEAVNDFAFVELETRYDYKSPIDKYGIDERFSIDRTKHTIFGADKAAADLICQEYGLYLGLNTVILRPGCLTGSGHSAVELHGFLSYLIKCVMDETEYKIYDEKGKRVRDNIDSYDVISIIDTISRNPPAPGTVYNIGGCRENSISIIEALKLARQLTGKEPKYSLHPSRNGDHIVYITNMLKFKTEYPHWKMKYNLEDIFNNIVEGYNKRV